MNIEAILLVIGIAFLIFAALYTISILMANAEEIETFEDCIESGIVPEICNSMFPLNIQGASASANYNYTGVPFP